MLVMQTVSFINGACNMKVLLLSVLLIIHKIIAQGPLADIAIRNGVGFMNSYGFKYVSVFSYNSKSIMHLIQRAWTSMRNDSIYLRVLKDNSTNTLSQDSYLLIDFDSQVDALGPEYVSFMQGTNCDRTLLMALPPKKKQTVNVLDTLLKAVNASNANLQFYFNDGSDWYHIIKVKNTEKAVAVSIDAHSFQYSNELDLQGLTITDVSANYMPHNRGSSCEADRSVLNEMTECQTVEGIAPDIFKPVARIVNITLRHIYDPTGNWGLSPVSGNKMF